VSLSLLRVIGSPLFLALWCRDSLSPCWVGLSQFTQVNGRGFSPPCRDLIWSPLQGFSPPFQAPIWSLLWGFSPPYWLQYGLHCEGYLLHGWIQYGLHCRIQYGLHCGGLSSLLGSNMVSTTGVLSSPSGSNMVSTAMVISPLTGSNMVSTVSGVIINIYYIVGLTIKNMCLLLGGHRFKFRGG
jgi:hypothetical protein